MDLIARAAMSYAEMAPYSDFLKVVVYHAVTGPRVKSWVANTQKSVLSDLSLEDALSLHYDLFGYDKNVEPKANEPTPRGGSPDYVFRETKRSVLSAEGKSKIYPGIGFNVPGGAPDDPETIYQAVTKAYEAGASGIVASREYEEMTVPNLKAVGRAVRDVMRTTVLILALLLASASWSNTPAATAACTTSTPGCTEWVTLGSGPARSMIYRSYSLDTRNESVRRALIMVHGTNRNADHYFATAMANRVLAGVADRVFTAFPGVMKKATWIGNPLRAGFLSQPAPAERM